VRVDTASDVNMAIERESYVISTLSARTAKLPPTQRTTHATANPETWRAGNVLIPGKAVKRRAPSVLMPRPTQVRTWAPKTRLDKMTLVVM